MATPTIPSGPPARRPGPGPRVPVGYRAGFPAPPRPEPARRSLRPTLLAALPRTPLDRPLVIVGLVVAQAVVAIVSSY
jgi:hypothetical protein